MSHNPKDTVANKGVVQFEPPLANTGIAGTNGETDIPGDELDEILSKFGSDLYDYITEKDIIKAAEIYSKKPMFKQAKQALQLIILKERREELSHIRVQYGHYFADTFINGSSETVIDRLAQLDTQIEQLERKRG